MAIWRAVLSICGVGLEPFDRSAANAIFWLT
jgi:hypothetical protein